MSYIILTVTSYIEKNISILSGWAINNIIIDIDRHRKENNVNDKNHYFEYLYY
jgi:hypothetical protein